MPTPGKARGKKKKGGQGGAAAKVSLAGEQS